MKRKWLNEKFQLAVCAVIVVSGCDNWGKTSKSSHHPDKDTFQSHRILGLDQPGSPTITGTTGTVGSDGGGDDSLSEPSQSQPSTEAAMPSTTGTVALQDGANQSVTSSNLLPSPTPVKVPLNCGPKPDVKEVGEAVWIAWWECKYRTSYHPLNLMGNVLLAVCPSAATDLRVPPAETSKIWCDSCKSQNDMEYLKCLNERTNVYIGPNNKGTSDGKYNCNDYSSIFNAIVTQCDGIKSSPRGTIVFGDSDSGSGEAGHFWNFVTVGGNCYLFDAVNNILVPTEC